METIDVLSKGLLNHPLSISKMSKKYITENNLFVFQSPEIWTIEKNIFYLLRNSEEIELDIKYHQRPEYLSYDKYGTLMLDKLLMRVNRIPSVEEFVTETLYVPTISAIITICNDNFPTKGYSELEEVSK